MRWVFIILIPLFAATFGVPALADPLPSGFKTDDNNGPGRPVTKDGVTTFQIKDRKCGTAIYDARGESDCTNGAVRSQIDYQTRAKVGQTVEYKFDIRVDPKLDFKRIFIEDSLGYEPGGMATHLSVAAWQGTFLHNFIYWLKLDSEHGLTFETKTCQPASDLGQWVTFSMKVYWTGDETGWIKVACNDQVIYARENIASNQSPSCYIQNDCNSSTIKDAKTILFQLGPKARGYGWSWKEDGLSSPFDSIQKDGITVSVRNVTVTPNPVLYDDGDKAIVAQLQGALKSLGCDPGNEDGEPTQTTRDAALSCRSFPNHAMPATFDVGGIRELLSLYSSPEASTLPLGTLPVPLPKPTVLIHAISIRVEDHGDPTQIVNMFRAHAEINQPKGVVGHKDADVPNEFEFLIQGRSFKIAGPFYWLQVLLQHDLTKKEADAVRACGLSPVVPPNGSVMAAIDFQVSTDGNSYRFNQTDCLIKALPASAAFDAEIILDHFRDIAIGMVKEGTISSIPEGSMRTFFEKVATGGITVETAAK